MIFCVGRKYLLNYLALWMICLNFALTIDMSVKVKDVIRALELFAPLPLQESYDNAGLQVGLTEAEVSGALLCLDVTEEVIAEAREMDCDLIVSHHPLLFRGLKRITDSTQVERCVRMALQYNIAIYSAHTNLDNAEDGVNYRIAEKLGLQDVELMMPRRVMVSIEDHDDSLQFLQRVKEAFGVECLMHNELLQRPIQSVAICGGAGDFMLDEAIRLQADAFLTGEMHYHQFFGHDQQIQIAVLGHYQSERYTPDLLFSVLGRSFPSLPLFRSTVNTNPIKYL